MTFKTPLRNGMLPGAFVAFAFFVLIATLDVSISPIIDAMDALIVWWTTTLFLVAAMDSFFQAGGS
jgi:uncharacterized membrane protein